MHLRSEKLPDPGGALLRSIILPAEGGASGALRFAPCADASEEMHRRSLTVLIVYLLCFETMDPDYDIVMSHPRRRGPYKRTSYRGRHRFGAIKKRKVSRRVIRHGYYGRGPSRVEFKAVDTSLNIACDTTGAVALLNGIARGDDINERIGRKVVLRSIEMRVESVSTNTTGLDQNHRVLVVFDRQANATALTPADVLTAVDINSPRNLTNRSRFKIIYDNLHHLNASGESGSHKVIDWYKRVWFPVTFNSGDAGTIADIQTGSLYLVVVGNQAPGGTAGAVGGKVRVRYTDE